MSDKLVPYRLWGCRPDRFDTEIEGEFAWTDHIVRTLGAAFEAAGAEIRRDVSLLPETHGVSVRADGLTLGILGDGDALRYGPVLRRVVAGGYLPTVPGRIWAADAGAYNDDPARSGRIIARVSVSLGAPARLVPRNDPPDVPYTLLPPGRTLQVTGEERHFDLLHPYADPPGKYALLVTLHEADGALVEVRVDDRACGYLGRRSSARLLPIVTHLSARGLRTAARAAVSGSRLAAEVTVSVTPADEIDERVLDGPPVIVPRLAPGPVADPPDPVLPMHRYHGWGGQIVVQGDRLWILREGPVARALGPVPLTPRRIRLRDVVDVQFRPALPQTDGMLRIVTGGGRDGAPSSADPDTVVFHHPDRQRFQALTEWLRHVAAVNAGPPS
ncbi:hypothetical protein G6038_00275 [Rhodococcus sp. 14C212]|uniref:hypothetical protein n=1 Tax=Rhodococcus sp. 14C212 TaxID=2711209 RepID=UPI0013EB3DA2|nr:hypothetical protein [Rhodococcus sp. 14C212]NGP03940.1 hypothetical protein [Rhodococcus sp. 14C212]